MELTDTHCHLDYEKFDEDRNAVIQRARAAGVTRILIPALNLKSARAAIRLTETYPMVYAAIGIHPDDANTWDPQTIPALRELATNLKVIAVGEIGLDYYWDSSSHDHQQKVLKDQLDLATELGLPVVIHCREKDNAEDGPCFDDLMNLLEKWATSLRSGNEALADRPGVLHSFSGSLETAQRAIDLGFFIGITGPVTYKNAGRRRQIISKLPLDRILIETDAPFLSPIPHRGKRNEPAYVCHIADKIAEIHSKNPEEIAAITTANAERLFAWGD